MIGRVIGWLLPRRRDIRCPKVANRRHLVEVREGRVIHIIPRQEFEELAGERFFRDESVWRGYWEDSFRWVYPRRNP